MTIRNIYSAHKSGCAGLCPANHPHCIYVYISSHTQYCKVKHAINVDSGTYCNCVTVLWTFSFDFATMTMLKHHLLAGSSSQ